MQALKKILPKWAKEFVHGATVKSSMRHVHGPGTVSLTPTEASVCCLVKNGEFYIEKFIEHYVKAGFSHIFLLDNGSSDNTVEIARQYGCTSVYSTSLPIKTYQGLMKRCFALKVNPAGWCLDVDIDEFFDYPMSDSVSLGAFLGYLNEHGYNAVVTQMLDLFSDRPLSDLQKGKEAVSMEDCRYYDLSEVQSEVYTSSKLVAQFASLNRVSNGDISLLFGGIRKFLYGLDCLLTKHSLFRTDSNLHLFDHVHFVNRATLADLSAVLLHYKFAGNAFEIGKQNERAFGANLSGYEKFLRTVESNPNLTLTRDSTVEFESVNELCEKGFIRTSARFTHYCSDLKARS